jgi:hypothetical protein
MFSVVSGGPGQKGLENNCRVCGITAFGVYFGRAKRLSAKLKERVELDKNGMKIPKK